MRLAYLSERGGETEQAEVYLREALEVSEVQRLRAEAMKASNNLGNLYARQQNYVEARKAYLQSLELAVKGRSPKGKSRAYLNLGNLDLIEGNWTQAGAEVVR